MNVMKIQEFVLMVNVEIPPVHIYVNVNRAIRYHLMEHFVQTLMSVKKDQDFVEMENVQIPMDHTNVFVILVTDYPLTDKIA